MPCLVCSQRKEGERPRARRDFTSTLAGDNEPAQ
jgi:hypothetical protein